MLMKVNWREVTPVLGHQDAIVWDVLHSVRAKEHFPQTACLEAILTIGHLELQGGGRVSSYHAHKEVEQTFCFLEGSGKMRLDDVNCPIEEGDFVYVPPKVQHQVINEGKDWLKYLIISGLVGEAREKSKVVKRNWREVPPVLGHQDAVVWNVLRSAGMKERFAEGACLRGARGIGWLRLQGRGSVSNYHAHENVEQIFCILEGSGKMRLDDVEYPIEEGDFVHVPPRVRHQVMNEGKEWLEYLIVSGDVEGE